MTSTATGNQSGALGTSLLFDVFALDQAVGGLLADAMGDGPLRPSEYAVYSAIFELEAASPTALAARLGMRLTTFIDQLRRVQGRGHARRIGNPGDRRSYRVVLTNAGLEAHRAANRQFEEAQRGFVTALAGLEPATREALRAMRAAADSARSMRAAGATGATPRPLAGRAG